MKKLIALLFATALAAAGFMLSPASADDAALNTPIGNAGVNESGQILILDGASTNEDPADGYVSIGEDGTVSCEDEGGQYNDDGTNVDEDGKDSDGDEADEDFEASGECDPSNQIPA